MAALDGPLDPGEADAIALALKIRADLLLMDDRQGLIVARSKGLIVIGTLGLLGLAAQRGLVDLAEAFEKMKQTNFRYSQKILDALLSDSSRQ